SLSPLSTHDTKRSEDVRARLNVLSEVPGEWADRVTRWAYLNRPHKAELEEGMLAPDANEEYLIYQTLVGAWPVPGEPRPSGSGCGSEDHPVPHGRGSPQEVTDFTARIQAYVKKALCEAKVHSSWINPDHDYEAAVAAFVDRLLDPGASAEFLADIEEFAKRVAYFGRINSLAQTTIRCTAPGVPDTYQS